MNALKILLVPAILAVSSAAFACDSYGGCYSPSYCYTPSYSSNYCYTPSYSSYASYGNSDYSNGYSAPYQSCTYSNWTYDQGHGYYYCTCSYRPSAYAPYSKYVCIYNRSYSNCVYYYNPVAKNYWGCYNIASKGFQVLGAADQRSTIAELPQDKFSAPVQQATIPGSQSGEKLTAPPALPADAVAALPAN